MAIGSIICSYMNACRHHERDNLQTELIRNRASQFSEPSSRRGSVGYYTRKYSIRFDDQLNTSIPTKRLSIPACDQSSKSTAVVILPSSIISTADDANRHYVNSICETSNVSTSITNIGTSRCDDQIPLLTSELATNTKDSLTHNNRKYSFNSLLPLVRPSNLHPVCSSLSSTNIGNDNNVNGLDLKTRRRASLSSTLRRNSFTKQPRTFCSTIVSKTSSKKQQQNKKSSIYSKEFMHKIERFRFIDDSASSTTTVTSPIESTERINNRKISNNVMTRAIEKFDNDDDDDDISSIIDRLNSDTLTNGSYSDLNILNLTKPNKLVNEKSFQPIKTLSNYQQTAIRPSAPIYIPHSISSLPLSKENVPRETTNGHSHSMDFRTIVNRRDLNLPIGRFPTYNEASLSSSTTTLTSIRSSTSLEFDDNTKPSGVLVDDDFLPMSSPIDEHFWDLTIKANSDLNYNQIDQNFPNVGTSPDIEVKHFDFRQLNTLSETSCDEDDNDEKSKLFDKSSSSNPSVHSSEQFEKTALNSDFICHSTSLIKQNCQNTSEDDDTQDNSINDASEGDDSADNGEIDLVQEFQLSNNNLWTTNDRDVFVIQEDDLLSAVVTIPTAIQRTQPTSIMKITNIKITDNNTDDQQQISNSLKPKVRFNLDPEYEREREWNKVNKLLGNSVEWTDEFEV